MPLSDLFNIIHYSIDVFMIVFLKCQAGIIKHKVMDLGINICLEVVCFKVQLLVNIISSPTFIIVWSISPQYSFSYTHHPWAYEDMKAFVPFFHQLDAGIPKIIA